jgi:prepilin-type N-terminal cleavage/methylation domain-containing protein
MVISIPSFSEGDMSDRAFTLLELVLVIAMLSVVALLFVSYSGNVGNVSVDSLTRKIQADIRYAQQLATSTGVAHGVNFVQGGNYVVYVGNINTPVTDPLDHQPMIEDMSAFGDIELGNTYRVEFNKIGTPTTGGGGNLSVVAGSGAARRVYVIENTGAVIVDVLGYGTGCSCEMCMAR